MIEKFLNYVRGLFNMVQQAERNSEEVKELQLEMKVLLKAFSEVIHDNERLRDYIDYKLQSAAKDRENDLLRLKIEMLESGRTLPPSTPLHEDETK